ncbi:MAG: hypothetical protein JNJ46_20520 [Myxococcales bacterium]|nr:hypothetical protein [Myxococcales bacterium]
MLARLFLSWPIAHREVCEASLFHDMLIARFRASDVKGTVVGTRHKGQAVCIRHPSPVLHSWGLRYLRRANGSPPRGIVVGAQPTDTPPATAYEFRISEDMAHPR